MDGCRARVRGSSSLNSIAVRACREGRMVGQDEEFQDEDYEYAREERDEEMDEVESRGSRKFVEVVLVAANVGEAAALCDERLPVPNVGLVMFVAVCIF